MKTLLSVLLIAVASSVNAAMGDEVDRSLAQTLFNTVDSNKKGYLHLGDVEAFRQLVFLGMDVDADQTITQDEYMAYHFGDVSLAQDLGKAREYDAARKVIFHFWDLDSDGQVNEVEHRRVTQYDFGRADIDSDGVLRFDEFYAHFTPHAAIRAAMR
ncbi:MAG: hypothetical protein AAF318_00690 [Pseudomonadota bacterium]